jgi:membrane protease YdiL (CAAX protease family)
MKGIKTMNASIGPSQPTTASKNLRQVMHQHPLFSFFFMAYAFSWIMSIPVVLSEWGFLPEPLFNIFFIIKAFAGPFLAAVIMVRITENKEGQARFRRRFFQARAGWQWYAFILLVIPALFLLGIIVQPGALASFQGFPRNSLPYYLVNYLVTFVIIFFFGGPLAEEPGWRGFALPRIQSRFGALRGALLLGVVWAFWHLPDFLTRAQGGGPGTGWGTFFTNLPLFVLLVVALNIVMTWVYNHTQGSLFIAILLHASVNTAGILPELFPTPGIPLFTLSNLALLIAFALPAVLIVALTRGRLGCQPGQEQVLMADTKKQVTF